jgi:regulator of RNase E activity RraA
MTPADEIAEHLLTLSTSTISDALDRLGIAGQVLGIGPLDRSFRVAGPAFTGRYEPVGAQGGTVGDYIDDVPAGSVVVLDNDGRADATVWGDILTGVAHRRGVAGTVIFGVCRDTERALQLGYPLFSVGTWMRTGKDRVTLVATQVPVSLGAVAVAPGDLIIGDADGVVVVPAEGATEVLEVARAIEAAEDRIRAAVDAGSRLDVARRQQGYHRLQTHGSRDCPGPPADGT